MCLKEERPLSNGIFATQQISHNLPQSYLQNGVEYIISNGADSVSQVFIRDLDLLYQLRESAAICKSTQLFNLMLIGRQFDIYGTTYKPLQDCHQNEEIISFFSGTFLYHVYSFLL